MSNFVKMLKLIIFLIICSFILGCRIVPDDRTEETETQNITRNIQSDNVKDHNITPTMGKDNSTPAAQNNSVTDTITPEKVTPNVVPTQPVDDVSNIVDTTTFEMESLKKIVITLVNDDLWYKTPEQSYFYPFESSTMDMEVYTKEDDPSRIWAIFNDQINNKDHFTGVKFISDKRGFLNEYEVFFGALTHQKAEKMMDDGFTFYEKTEISFGKATKPVYPDTTAEKEAVVNNMLNDITHDMARLKFDKGAYTIYVCNFRDNSGRTSAVIENSRGDIWIMEMDVFDDGSTEVDNIVELDPETLKTWSELIKDNTVRVEDVTLD